MINLTIDERYIQDIQSSGIEVAAKNTLQHERKNEDSDISIVFTDDQQIQQLNNQYLGINSPTDVLSFPGNEIDPDTGHVYLGDIIISCPQARAQAHKGGHSYQAELELLVVHGVLHLLGHDHADEEEKVIMWAAQRGILQICHNPLFDQF